MFQRKLHLEFDDDGIVGRGCRHEKSGGSRVLKLTMRPSDGRSIASTIGASKGGESVGNCCLKFVEEC